LMPAWDDDVGLFALHADGARALVKIGRLLVSNSFIWEVKCVWLRHRGGGFRRHGVVLGLSGSPYTCALRLWMSY
jgi:hypothetical protein